jgi:hypothetical protein
MAEQKAAQLVRWTVDHLVFLWAENSAVQLETKMVGRKADLTAVLRVYWMAALLVAWLAGMWVVLMVGLMVWQLAVWMVASLGSSKVVQKAVQRDCLKVVPSVEMLAKR